MWLRGVAVWLLLAVVAVSGGILREAFLAPRFSESGAHLLGTGAVVLVFLMVIAGSIQWIVPGLVESHLLYLGVFWVLLTITFEFGFGHFVVGHPWSRLLHDYNLLAGRVWVLVLLTLLFAPTVFGRLKS
ncbi:hypothetical protein ACFL3S_05160 [Gemmatimonadota bacterium]